MSYTLLFDKCQYRLGINSKQTNFMSKKKIEITPETSKKVNGIKSIRAIKENYDLIKQLTKIDLLSQYKKSFTGFAWMVINPLFTIVIWLFLHKAGLFNPGDTTIPYTAFLLISVTLWNFTLGYCLSISTLITTSAKLIIHNNFPHEVVIIQKTLVHTITYLITILIVLLSLAFFKVYPTFQILLMPLTIIPAILFWLGTGLLLAVIEVVAIDIYNVLIKATALVIYITPVIYSSNIESSLIRNVIEYNPLAYIFITTRELAIGGNPSFDTNFWISSLLCSVFFLIAYRIYKINEQKLIERIPQ